MSRVFDNETYSINGNHQSRINPQIIRLVLYIFAGICALYLFTSLFRSPTILSTVDQTSTPISIPATTTQAPPQQPFNTTFKEFDFELLLKKDPKSLSLPEKKAVLQFYAKLTDSGFFPLPLQPPQFENQPQPPLQKPSQLQPQLTPPNSFSPPSSSSSTSSSSTPSSSTSTSSSSIPFQPSIPPLFEGHEIIVTLTTIPDRLQYLNATLLSLVSQTVPPTEIVLNIPYLSRRFSNSDGTPLVYDLPLEFIRYIHALTSINPKDPRSTLKNTSSVSSTPSGHTSSSTNNSTSNHDIYIDPHNLDFEPIIFPYSFTNLTRIPRITIHRCDDDGPATKLLPTLAREFSLGRLDSILMIADDDVIYPPNWVESMVGYYLSRPELRYSAIGARGYCVPPSNVWEWRIISQIAISAQQLYNITKNLNTPHIFDPHTNQYTSNLGSPDEEHHRTLVTPNSHRFIFRQHNYTTVLQTGAENVYQPPVDYADLHKKSNHNDDGNATFNDDDLNNDLTHDSSWQENDDLATKVVINKDWMFAYLFDENHPSYSKNPHHTHPTSDIIGTLDDIQRFIDHELGYNSYDPIDTHIESILPYQKHSKKYMSHTPVDIITGNNGFLMRPYYFLRYAPFIGNLTRVFVERYELTSHNKFATRREDYQYTTANNMWGKQRKFYQTEYDRIHHLLVDQDGKNHENVDSHVPLSEYATHLKYVLQEGDKIYTTRQAAVKKAFEDAIANQVKIDLEKKNRKWDSHPSGSYSSSPPSSSSSSTSFDNQNCTHPQLDATKLSAFDYHLAHLHLHNQLDQVTFECKKHDDILYQYSQDAILQAEELTSPLSNIIPFGSFGPWNRDEFRQRMADKLDADFKKDPSGKMGKKSHMMFDFSQNTRALGVLGSNGTELPDSVYYMDDIWFNGILAANNVSRVVISMTTDPIHRPKMQEHTTTLEQVPVGRAFHNNVLLKSFEQYWSNCPYIAPNITIPEFYLRYYALSGKSIEEQRDDALHDGKRLQPGQNATTSTKNLDDYRNRWTNPWQGWGVKDNETNVSTQFYFSPNKNKENGTKRGKKGHHDIPSGSLPSFPTPDTVPRSPVDKNTIKPNNQNTSHGKNEPYATNSNDVRIKDSTTHKQGEDVDFSQPDTKVNAENVNEYFQQIKKQQKLLLDNITKEHQSTKNKALDDKNHNETKSTTSSSKSIRDDV